METKKRRSRTRDRYAENGSDHGLALNLKYRYNMTIENYDKLRARQNYRCAICGLHEDDSRIGGRSSPGERKNRLNVDHDHDTGRVRGLLCAGCNVLVGYAEHEQLECALAYLGLPIGFLQ